MNLYAYKYDKLYFGFSKKKLKSNSKLYSVCELSITENKNGRYFLINKPVRLVDICFVKEEDRHKYLKVSVKEIKLNKKPKKKINIAKLLKKNNKE